MNGEWIHLTDYGMQNCIILARFKWLGYNFNLVSNALVHSDGLGDPDSLSGC